MEQFQKRLQKVFTELAQGSSIHPELVNVVMEELGSDYKFSRSITSAEAFYSAKNHLNANKTEFSIAAMQSFDYYRFDRQYADSMGLSPAVQSRIFDFFGEEITLRDFLDIVNE